MTAMAKKHGQKDSSEVYFDTTTKTVMAQTTLSQDKLKTKIAAVREVVSRSSNNDILLVLQYFDYDVDKTIQSFVEDGASEVLKEWNFTGKKSKNNKKNRKKGGGHNDSKPQNEKKAVEHSGEQGAVMKTSQVNNVDISTGPPSITNAISQPHTVRDGSHQDNSTKSEPYKDRVDAVSHKDRPTFLEFKKETATPLERHVNYSLSLSASGDTSAVLDDVSVISKTKRQRNSSECSNTSNSASTGGRNKHKKPMAVLERSVKDLQRTTVPLGRYKNLLNEEIDKSLKRMKKAFDGIRKAVDEREAEMIQQLKAVKLEGNELLEGRQNKAADLKSMTERGLVLKDSEIAELKAEIKHFVGERKVDEELGKTYRFKYEDETVIKSIREFGEIVPIKTRYTTRRQSVSSVTSSVVSHDDTTPLPTPTTPLPVSNDKDDAEDDTDEATAAELAELSARLQNSLKFQGYSNRRWAPTRKPQSQEKPKQNTSQDAQAQPGSPQKSRTARRRNRNHQRGSNSSDGKNPDKVNDDGAAADAQATSTSPRRNISGNRNRQVHSPVKSQASATEGKGVGRPRNNYYRDRQHFKQGDNERTNDHSIQGNGDSKINGTLNDLSTKDVNRNDKIMAAGNDALPQRKPRKRGPHITHAVNGLNAQDLNGQ